MSHELFAAGEPAAARRTRITSSLLAASVLLHLAAVAALIVISVLVPGVVPSPRAAGLEWSGGPRLVRLQDIPLPPAPVRTMTRTRAASESPAAPAAPIPFDAPTGLAPEDAASPTAGVPGGTGSTDTVADAGLVAGAPIDAPPPPAAPQSPVPVRMHSGITAPVKIAGPAPVYPALARSAGIRGVVILEATIGLDGDVSAVRVLRSVPLLDEAAMDAVRQWRFAPALLNGEPVAVVMTVTINFTYAR